MVTNRAGRGAEEAHNKQSGRAAPVFLTDSLPPRLRAPTPQVYKHVLLFVGPYSDKGQGSSLHALPSLQIRLDSNSKRWPARFRQGPVAQNRP